MLFFPGEICGRVVCASPGHAGGSEGPCEDERGMQTQRVPRKLFS